MISFHSLNWVLKRFKSAHPMITITTICLFGLIAILIINVFTFRWLWLPQSFILAIPIVLVVGQFIGSFKQPFLWNLSLDRSRRWQQAYPIMATLVSDVAGVTLLLGQLQAFDGSQADFLYVLVMTVLFKTVFVIIVMAMRYRRALIADLFLSLITLGLSFILYTLAVTV